MDLDAYTAAHLPQWRRLEGLVCQKRLTSAEADELLDLYQRTATHLSVVRSAAPEPELINYLSWLLTRARSHAHRSERGNWRGVVSFFTDTFPAALYRTRHWWLTVLAANVLVAFLLGWWLLRNPEVAGSLMTRGQIQQLIEHDFANYYTAHAATSFSFQVWTNNALVAAKCIAMGVLGVPVVIVLWQNIVNLAIIGAIMIDHGRGDVFFGLITPHGLLELTCVFVAGGLGLRLFWSWVEPGARTRSRAIAEEGRAAASVALGLVFVLLICGLIEGFVTPSPLPTWMRIGIGGVAEAAFFVYVYTVGRWAVLRGQTGDLELDRAGYTELVTD